MKIGRKNTWDTRNMDAKALDAKNSENENVQVKKKEAEISLLYKYLTPRILQRRRLRG